MKNPTQPIPGKPVRGSKSGKPIMALFDLLGRNWAMGILWHLSQQAMTFRKLQAKCETISPTTLNKRLKELTHARLIERSLNGYTVTEKGKELAHLLSPLNHWAEQWAKAYQNKKTTAR